MLFVCNTKASAKAFSASRLACKIFCAEMGFVGTIGGLSGRRGLLLGKYPKRRTVWWTPFLVGLVSRELAKDRGIIGVFFGIVPVCLYAGMLYKRDDGDVLLLVAGI